MANYAKLPYDAKRVMSGTFGTAYADSDKISEVTSFNAKISFTRTDVNMAGSLGKGHKLIGFEVSGELKVNKIRSLFQRKVLDNLAEGKDTLITFKAKLDDPDAWGAEEVIIHDATLSDLTLMDWEVGKLEEDTFQFSGAWAELVSTVDYTFS